MTTYQRILRAVRETPAARDRLALALAHMELENIPGMALAAAQAADILATEHPELGDPIRLAQLLQASFVEWAVTADRAPLN